MNQRDRDRCSCVVKGLVVDGKAVVEVERLDPDCRAHGLSDEWPAGHPLRVHARYIETPGPLWIGAMHRRLETPRETEARLLQEAAVT